MLEPISSKIANIRHNLSSLDNQPIGKAALAVLIFLDLFILASIFDGLSEHSRQLTGPAQLVPQYCRDIVIENEWNKSSRLYRLAEVVTESRGSYQIKDKRERTLERHATCKPIAQLLWSIEDDTAVSVNLKSYLDVTAEVEQLNTTIKHINNTYDTSLLEDIADNSKDRANVESLRKDFQLKTETLNRLTQRQASLDSELNKDKKISQLFTLLDSYNEDDRESLKADLRKLNFWHPVKRLGMEMIFLLPLFLVFYFWNARSLAANRPFQSLVSSHLLAVVFIPVLFKISELVYEILPKKFFKELIDLLESLKLVALWHYLVMAAIILASLALIYLFQKKLFSREKLMIKRISKGACQNCGTHLPENASVCPFCGFEQYKQCSNCGKSTYVFGKYCKECGHGE
jgi:RNA polymerase subunit RPABC4/transcription elongation factor Spt4